MLHVRSDIHIASYDFTIAFVFSRGLHFFVSIFLRPMIFMYGCIVCLDFLFGGHFLLGLVYSKYKLLLHYILISSINS